MQKLQRNTIHSPMTTNPCGSEASSSRGSSSCWASSSCSAKDAGANSTSSRVEETEAQGGKATLPKITQPEDVGSGFPAQAIPWLSARTGEPDEEEGTFRSSIRRLSSRRR
ncbi:phospholemman isoform X2 [Lemur catta]|uniref:phospholemman isoform X2 n=1 Tax=Lemur catta TaxID=9447 RepID=UPI001E26DCE3|nr:phospholemman isoform X2 [Lemur catta]